MTTVLMSEDDKRHYTKAAELIQMAKDKSLVGVIWGNLPDADDSYVLATDQVALTDYFASGAAGGDNSDDEG